MFGPGTCSTRTATAPSGVSLSSLPFGAIKGPGLFLSRNHSRSCRSGLARQRGGGASAPAHTNALDSRTCRRMVADTRSLGLVTQRERPPLMANSNGPRALLEMLCGARGARNPACGIGTAIPSGGPTASRWSVASAMTSDSRMSRTHRRGTNDVSARAGVQRPASFRPAAGETP